MSTRRGNRIMLRGPLIVLTIMFASGAKLATVLPVTDAGAQAWAEAFSVSSATADTAAPAAVAEQTGLEGLPDGAPDEILQMIAAERARLDSQRAALSAREAEIAFVRDALASERSQLEELRAGLEELLARAESRHEADVSQLVDLYKGMKPREAAGLLASMDLEVTVHVMTAMEPRSAAPILAEMPPHRAQAVSQVLLERSKLPGDRQPVQVRLR